MLRVWFSDGVNGFQQLSPDRPFASVPYALNAGSVNLGSGSVSRSMLASDILSDLNGIIGKNRLSQQVLDDLNRTITLAMLDSNTQTILEKASSLNLSATISGEHNITNELIIFADRNTTANLMVNLPSASANDGRSIRLIPTNNKPIRIESLMVNLMERLGEFNQFVEVVSNQGVWFQ